MKRVLLGVITALSTFTFTASAFAAPPVIGDGDGLDTSAMDVTERGTLTVIKSGDNPFDDPVPGGKPNGPVEGQQIRISKVPNISLQGANWQDLNRLRLKELAPKALPVTVAVTDEAGKAVFRDLPVGMYLVDELSPADTTHKYRQIAPFLVTIPIADPQRAQWSYRFVVTPKLNSEKPKITKTVPIPAKQKYASKNGALPMLSKTGSFGIGICLLAMAAIVAGIGVCRRRDCMTNTREIA